MSKRISFFLTMLISAMFMMAVCVCADTDSTIATANIPVTCKGENTDETFEYQMKPSSKEFQNFQNTSLKLSNGQTGVFTVDYTYPGTYHYEIFQVKGTDPDTKYDDTVYNASVYVTNDDYGNVITDVVVYVVGHIEKNDACAFGNYKPAPESTTSSVESKPEATPTPGPNGTNNVTNNSGNNVTDATAPSGTTQTSSSEKTNGNVGTGDTSQAGLYALLLAAAACALVAVKGRRRMAK